MGPYVGMSVSVSLCHREKRIGLEQGQGDDSMGGWGKGVSVWL